MQRRFATHRAGKDLLPTSKVQVAVCRLELVHPRVGTTDHAVPNALACNSQAWKMHAPASPASHSSAMAQGNAII